MSEKTVGEHIVKAVSAHNQRMIAIHKSAMKDPESYHEAAMASHEQCDKEMGQCLKAIEAADLQKSQQVVPHQLSSTYSQSFPVPRAGQPALPAKPNVPLQFQKLVAVDEDEEIQLRS